MQTGLIRISAALMFLAVALGAFGAHALKATLAAHGVAEAWHTAVLYQFVHATALLVIGVSGIGPRIAAWFFGLGILLFSGSLYLYCLTNAPAFAAFTPPLGGLLFMAGWICLVLKPRR